MKVLKIKDHHDIVYNYQSYYKNLEYQKYGKIDWMDAGYYRRQYEWLSANYNCIYLPNRHELVFINERDYTLFVLRWS